MCHVCHRECGEGGAGVGSLGMEPMSSALVASERLLTSSAFACPPSLSMFALAVLELPV